MPAPRLAQSAGAAGLAIDHFGLEDGLPGTYIPDMAVSGVGMLWLHASGQLVSFDGLEFEVHGLEQLGTTGLMVTGLAATHGVRQWS
jgi:hypothetical protein